MLTLLLGLACYKTDYLAGPQPPAYASRPPDKEVWNHRMIYGIIELEGPLQVQEICEDGQFSRIHVETDVISGLISYLVNGTPVGGFLYSPNMIYVWCADGSNYRASVDSGNVLAMEAPLGQEIPARIGAFEEACSTELE